MRIRILALSLLLIPISTMSAEGATTPADSVKTFVQSFYDWYVPLALAPKNGFSYEIVLNQKLDYLTSALRSALKKDLDASEKNPDYIVGLDFDPILASQDPCDHYVTGAVTQAGKNYDVSIFCKGQQESYVSAEVMQQGNSWVIVNFIYPPHDGLRKDDLLSLLNRLQKDRDRSKK